MHLELKAGVFYDAIIEEINTINDRFDRKGHIGGLVSS